MPPVGKGGGRDPMAAGGGNGPCPSAAPAPAVTAAIVPSNRFRIGALLIGRAVGGPTATAREGIRSCYPVKSAPPAPDMSRIPQGRPVPYARHRREDYPICRG